MKMDITPEDVNLFVSGRWDWSPADWLKWAMDAPTDVLAQCIRAAERVYETTTDDDANEHLLEILAAFSLAITPRFAGHADPPTLEEI